jgi:CO/xanthine dehydrogenase FAD-binding subunit
MLALNARFTVANRERTRTVPADDFFLGLFATALEPGELLTAVTIPPRRASTAYGFQEISRRHGDFALAGVAAAVTTDGSQRVTEARIALLSVGDRPLLAAHASRAVSGEALTPEVIRAAADAAAHQDIDPPSDIHASARYRRQLVNVLTRRVLETANRELNLEQR